MRHTRMSIGHKFGLFVSVLALGTLLAAPVAPAAAGTPGGAGPIYLPLVYGQPAPKCAPGYTLDDFSGDVTSSYVDITQFSSSLSGERLTAVFKLRSLPATLTFNRNGIRKNLWEYAWQVSIDVDNNTSTGDPGITDNNKGIDYELFSEHTVDSPNSPITGPIPDHVVTWLAQYQKSYDAFVTVDYNAKLTVDTSAGTITISAVVPGITSDSRIDFDAYDYNPGGISIWDRSDTCGIY